ncbi:DUF885 domain-containing protein [Wenzhouxiangella marina]|uniref:DUF885 domain-containing protein n=1 Tax=Wenzhouxiangella marina TaxID=1579979 RepID=UPI0006730D30|nr:DUF885 domain-containing protein [Wenzhouxiangella marina]MBB6085598.1 uncharacterized protein (DUF885 family) [Wenzhouxiangella marina]
MFRTVSVLTLLLALLVACGESTEPAPRTTPAPEPSMPDEVQAPFAQVANALIERMIEHSPEWAVYQGRYEGAGRVTIPNAEQRAATLALIDQALAELGEYEPERLDPAERTDLALLENRLRALRWYQEEFRGWAWMPSQYNVAGVINVLLNTDFAPLDERLALIEARLSRVPDYYAAARANLERPTLEHTELAIQQNRGGLASLGEPLEAKLEEAGFDDEARDRFLAELGEARAAIEGWIAHLEGLQAELEASGEARSFRIGAELYEPKFAFDIQADFTAAQLYQRALAEKERVLADMDEIAVGLWPNYFPDVELPEQPRDRIARLIDHLSDRHVTVDEFIPEIRRQIPALADFVREHHLLEQDPDKPLVVRETPEYMRGGGAIASVSAPGPFNPGAETYYNVTPLETYGEELAASYLREYNHWILQILNIHEAIPGHYTQLLHANRSPSLVKSLFGNGAMVEGWAVYAERMMLEAGWGDQEPEMWLMYGKWALRVIHNAILDYAVHVEGMGRDEALRMLQEDAFQEVSEATQKWRRVTLSQVQLTSYFSGYAEIYDFRERQRAALGEGFDLEAFHNQFLSYGSAPVAVIAELMGDSRPSN